VKRKLRVIKLKGGGADAGGSKSPGKGTFKSPSRAYEPPPGEKGGPGYVGPSSKGSNIKNKVVAAGNTTKRISLGAIPFTPAGFVIKGLTAVENMRRAKRAKGEYYLTNKKILPINRDFYRQYGRTLDTKIGSADTQYMKDAGIIGFKKFGNPDNGGPKLCPDGTMPPCVSKPIAAPKNKFDPKSFFDFKAYNSGGVSSGPPPEKGPNPQVPPVKMKKGKMNKMSCPHRPDGIRGMGCAIKGHKFTGVK
jgi:hypothetical protein